MGLAWIDDALAELAAHGLLRQRRTRTSPIGARIVLDGRELINFGSNDYLGLAGDPRLGGAVAEAARDGWGGGASPLVVGRSDGHERLEAALADFEGTEAALLFASGYAANTGAVAALVGRGDHVFADELNHASLIDGCRLSRADVHVYPHGDVQTLERLLGESSRTGRRLIVTDALFSMDGDLAPLVSLVDLAEQHDCMLLVDEAHATGVFGARGRGVAESLGIEQRVLIRVGTLSKALGCAGGFVCGSRALIEWLANRARPYVFSTAPPPATCAAALAALEIVRAEPARRSELLARAESLRGRLRQLGCNLGSSASQIVPVVVGEAERAVALSVALAERGLFVPAIRPPSVPPGRSLLRISLSHVHDDATIAALVAALASIA